MFACRSLRWEAAVRPFGRILRHPECLRPADVDSPASPVSWGARPREDGRRSLEALGGDDGDRQARDPVRESSRRPRLDPPGGRDRSHPGRRRLPWLRGRNRPNPLGIERGGLLLAAEPAGHLRIRADSRRAGRRPPRRGGRRHRSHLGSGRERACERGRRGGSARSPGRADHEVVRRRRHPPRRRPDPVHDHRHERRRRDGGGRRGARRAAGRDGWDRPGRLVRRRAMPRAQLRRDRWDPAGDRGVWPPRARGRCVGIPGDRCEHGRSVRRVREPGGRAGLHRACSDRRDREPCRGPRRRRGLPPRHRPRGDGVAGGGARGRRDRADVCGQEHRRHAALRDHRDGRHARAAGPGRRLLPQAGRDRAVHRDRDPRSVPADDQRDRGRGGRHGAAGERTRHRERERRLGRWR